MYKYDTVYYFLVERIYIVYYYNIDQAEPAREYKKYVMQTTRIIVVMIEPI